MAKNPMYSEYLEYAPTFKWGGREWGQGDRAAFDRYLRQRGSNLSKWSRNHRTAAKSFDPVEAQIYSAVQPQLTGIDAERKRTADLYSRRMANLTSFTTALMPYLQNVPGAIMGPYREGAAGVESAGSGYGGRLNADSAAEAEGMNAVLSSIGAPEGQQISGGDPGGVLAGVGGLEADLMRASGGAYGAAASQLPKTASLESQLMMKGLIEGAGDADKGFSEQVLAVLQGLPGARQQLGDNAAKNRLAQQKFKLDQIEEEHDFYIKQAALASARGDDARSDAYLALAAERERRYQLAQQGYDTEGNLLPNYKIDKNGNVVKRGSAKSPSTSSTTPGTPAWKAKQKENVGKAQAKIEKDVDAYLASAPSYQPNFVGPPDPRVKAQLTKDLWAKYSYLATTPTAKKALRRAIALAVKRWKPKASSSGSSATPGGALPAPEK